MRGIVHQMPADFVEHMHETYDSLMARYDVSEGVARRWVVETGLPRRNNVQARGFGSAPSTFRTAAQHMSTDDLSERYGVSDAVIIRWKRELGLPVGSERVVSTATFECAHIDMSLLDRAVKHLQRDRPVTRRNTLGHYDPSGSRWLCGTRLLDAAGVLNLAEQRGFVADAWKQVAA